MKQLNEILDNYGKVGRDRPGGIEIRGKESTSEFTFKHTQKAKACMEKYRELQGFLTKFPLLEDRFSNDFVAFNIAFNLRDCERLPA